MYSFINPRSDNPIIRWWGSIDRLTFVLLMSLACFGVVMVGTASPSVATRIDLGAYHFLSRHIMFLMPALACMVFLSGLSQKNVWRFASLLFAVAVVGVILTLLSGDSIKGAMRWIRVAGFSIQPSEFLKPAFVILSAWFLSKQKMQIHFPGVMIALGLYGLSAALLLMQPDFGMFFLISIVFGMQIFLAGCPLRYVAILGAIGLVAVIMAYFTLGHVQDRVNDFLFPETGDTYQVDLSKQAFINGGIIGTGLGQGEVKNQVPDIHSDFIFTAIGEEWGFVISSIFVACFGYVFYRIFGRISRSDSIFVMLAAGGLAFMLAMQCFIHMGSALQLIPAKGMTLPLISYGGSSLISVGISFGLILALTRGIIDDRRTSGWRHLTRKDI